MYFQPLIRPPYLRERHAAEKDSVLMMMLLVLGSWPA
jgi:hypothetical protein